MADATLIRADARALPLADESVDLVVTSPPYFGLRSYQDGGEHYDGQIGAEASSREFVDALIDCTREMVRVLKPTGSIFVNLGDKYNWTGDRTWGVPEKSLAGIPWRYAIRCVDELGLVLRAELVWSKPNGLPESVTDRVRRSHETWFHFTRAQRYFSAVDKIREPHTWGRTINPAWSSARQEREEGATVRPRGGAMATMNPLGKLPGSVWEVPTQPLKVPPDLAVDHYAAFPMEWPRRLIQGWCPREVCTACGEGRAPIVEQVNEAYAAERQRMIDAQARTKREATLRGQGSLSSGAKTNGAGFSDISNGVVTPDRRITGYACACPDITASSTPGVVLDPFGGTGTTALVATMLGRTGISVDLSADYGRLAQWRCSDPKERARAAGTDPTKVAVVAPEQADLFGGAA